MPRFLRTDTYEPLLTGAYVGTTPLALEIEHLPQTSSKVPFYIVEVEAYQPPGGTITPVYGLNLAPLNVLSLSSFSAGSTVTIRASDRGYRSRSTDSPPGGVVAYPPYLTDVTITEEVAIPPSATTISWADGTITLANDNGWLDGFIGSMNADGRAVSVKRGEAVWDDTRGIFVDPAYGDLVEIFAGIGGPWFPDATTLSIPIRDASYWVEKPYQKNLYTGGGGYGGDASLAGTRIPRARGGTSSHPIRNVRPVLIDEVNLIYQYNDARGEVRGIWEGRKSTYNYDGDVSDLYSGTPPLSGHYRSDNSRGLIQLGSIPAYTLTLDVTGEFPVAGAITNFALIAYYLLVEDMALPAAYIDAASFTAAASAYAYTGGLFFSADDSADGAEAASRALAGAFAKAISGTDGKIQCLVLRGLAGTETPVFTITTANCADVRPQRLDATLDPPPYRIRLLYEQNWTLQTDGLNQTAPASLAQFAASPGLVAFYGNTDTAAQFANPNDLDPFGGSLTVQADAQAVVDDVGPFLTSQRRLFDCDVPVAYAVSLQLGDIVKLIWPLAGLRNGRLARVVRKPLRTSDDIITLRVLV